jgi:hypothetical protein
VEVTRTPPVTLGSSEDGAGDHLLLLWGLRVAASAAGSFPFDSDCASAALSDLGGFPNQALAEQSCKVCMLFSALRAKFYSSQGAPETTKRSVRGNGVYVPSLTPVHNSDRVDVLTFKHSCGRACKAKL